MMRMEHTLAMAGRRIAMGLLLAAGLAMASGCGKINEGRAEVSFEDAVDLMNAGDLASAKPLLADAVKLDPKSYLYVSTLGYCQAQLGDFPDALASMKKADSLAKSKEDKLQAKMGISEINESLGDMVKSTAAMEEAMAFVDDLSEDSQAYLMNALAWNLATSWDPAVLNGERAVSLALKAGKIGGSKEPAYLDTIAASFARKGDFTNAVKAQATAVKYADDYSDYEKAEMKARLALYQKSKPYSEPKR